MIRGIDWRRKYRMLRSLVAAIETKFSNKIGDVRSVTQSDDIAEVAVYVKKKNRLLWC